MIVVKCRGGSSGGGAPGLDIWFISGVDSGFQVREGALKKIAPSGGRREMFWGISC
jgi:hypothetical protein